jgi:uncharacterized protein (TIGR01777 family)
MKTVLSGATGFIGKAITEKILSLGGEAIVLSRGAPAVIRDPGGRTVVPWDGRTPGEWIRFLEGADAVINLAGESIAAKPWTPGQKQKILSSRVDATAAIVQAISGVSKKPRVLLNASAVGYYGDVPEGDVTESSPRGGGFLADVCEQWEETAMRAEKYGARVIIARFGIVLEKDGGMLGRILAPFRYFLGGPLGSGRQWLSWVHREDLIEAVLFLAGQSGFSGPFNLTAPDPRTMADFCEAVGKALSRPSLVKVPAFAIRWMLGEMSEMLLTGQRALPERLLRSGFRFKYPSLGGAFAKILQK